MTHSDKVRRVVRDRSLDEGGGSGWVLPDLSVEDVNTFYSRGDGCPSRREMQSFWSAYRSWLAARGFYLHVLQEHDYMDEDIWCPPTVTSAAPLPYAERCADDPTGTRMPRTAHLQCAPAQDSHGRDVTIKLVNTYTDEYSIYQDLLGCNELFGQDFQGVLPPVAILDTPHRFSFVVMPTWNDYNPLSNFETVGHVLRCMHYTLKGLKFLHSRRVAHRDIDQQNIMSNFYTFGGPSPEFKTRLVQHGRTSRILYCLFDFNLSVQFPLDTPLRECRLVVKDRMFSHSPYMPLDVSYGAYDYDPFAYDVACLGNMFRALFATIVRNVPEMALLFDNMTTHVICDRFSASEALAYFDQTVQQLPAHVLEHAAVLDPSLDVDDTERYWSLLPPEVAAAWAKYRTPPVSLLDKVLDHILQYRLSRNALLHVRYKLRI